MVGYVLAAPRAPPVGIKNPNNTTITHSRAHLSAALSPSPQREFTKKVKVLGHTNPMREDALSYDTWWRSSVFVE
jgi:hypothetical protein